MIGIVQAARVGHQPVREHLLGLGHPRFGQRDRLVLLVHDVVARGLQLLPILRLDVALRDGALLQPRDHAIDLVVEVGGLFGGARDDERRARLVDEDAVHLVHDREVVPALHHRRQLELHVVAQVVEAELVVGAVGDVGAVGHLALLVVQLVLDDADRQAQEAVEPSHPLRVAAGQVVVHGHDVDALAGERIQVGGQRGDQRLALAGLHLRDAAAVQHHAADQLDVEVPHVQHPPAGLAYDGKGLHQQVVHGGALGDPLLELERLGAQPFVGEGLDLGFERADFAYARLQPLELTFVLSTDDLGE